MLYETEVEFPLNSSLISKSFIAYNKQESAENKPVVIIAPDWRGRSEFYCEIARKIAQLGYVGFAIDMYGNASLGSSNEDKKTLFEPLKQNRDELMVRIQSVYNFISKEPYVDKRKIAAIGYCFGGMCVLDLARSGANLSGVVSLHGLLYESNKPLESKIKSKILVLHGYEDTYVKPDQVLDFANEMTRKNADWQIHMYGHTSHSFTRPDANDPVLGLKYDATANKRSWDATKYFLNEIF